MLPARFLLVRVGYRGARPLLGIIAYCLLRPPLLQIDRDEQELEIALKQRELMNYGECANCGYRWKADFVLCARTATSVSRQPCGTCNPCARPHLDQYCPYCATPLPLVRARVLPCSSAALERSSRSGRRPSSRQEAGAPAQSGARRAVTTSVRNRSRLANNGAASLFLSQRRAQGAPSLRNRSCRRFCARRNRKGEQI